MRILLKLRKDNMVPCAYDFSIEFLDQLVPIPYVGEKFYFYHYDEPMFIEVSDRTFEITGDGTEFIYEITLWGSYHMNIEGQRGEDL